MTNQAVHTEWCEYVHTLKVLSAVDSFKICILLKESLASQSMLKLWHHLVFWIGTSPQNVKMKNQ